MSGMWSALQWSNPWWLLLVLLPLPLLFWRPRLAQLPRLEQFIQRHLWAKVLSAPLQTNKRRQQISFLIIWLLLSIALAGPFLVKQDKQQLEQLAANIVVIIDISPSMGVEDVAPSRLERSKKLLTDFSHSLEQHRLALIAFSANAYTVLPLSHDTQAFRHFLNQLDPSLAYVTGSNLSRALRLAQHSLDVKDSAGHSISGLVLLISDGEIHDPEALPTAANLNQAGHKLITLGIGTEQGGPVPLAAGRLVRQNGKILTSQLQRATLQSLAQVGGGQYFDLQPEAWSEIETEIGMLQQSIYQTEIKTQMGQPLFPIFIFLALMILFWQGLNRPRGLAMLFVSFLFIHTQPADAAPWNEAKGLEQLQSHDNLGALQTYGQLQNYVGLMGQGVAAYRLQEWQAALTAFQLAYNLADNNQDKARAAYNQGNALTQLQQIDQAIASFELAIQLQRSYPRAAHNLLLLNKTKQEWGGGQKQAAQQQPRPGPNQTDESMDTGAGADADADNNPLSGQSEQGARISKTDGQQSGDREKQDATLSESLAQWSQMDKLSIQPPAQAWQQYRNLKEDNQTMLQRRFEIEDKRVSGLVEQKPW